MRLTIDPSQCTGHGRCYTVAPDAIEPDDEGRGRVVVTDPSSALGEQARLAVANCPEGAVELAE